MVEREGPSNKFSAEARVCNSLRKTGLVGLHIRQKTARSGSSGLTAGSGGETWHRVNDVLFFMTVNPRAVIPVGIKPTDFGIATWVTKPATISWRPAAPLPRSAALIAILR